MQKDQLKLCATYIMSEHKSGTKNTNLEQINYRNYKFMSTICTEIIQLDVYK